MRLVVSPPPRIAVVGAGIAGLCCARTLQDRFLEVTVFDKGREVGGRMSTRRTRQGWSFDHGAQYFTARDQRFKRHVQACVERGLVARWDPKIASLGKDRSESPPHRERFVGVPGMNSVCKQLATDLDIKTTMRIAALERKTEGSWLARDEEDRTQGRFDYVVLAMPPSQAAELLPPYSDLYSRSAGVEMKPCWAVLVTLKRALEVDYDAAFVESEHLSWVAKTSSKPGRQRAPERWVLHASPGWSERRLEDDKASVESELVKRFEQLAGIRVELDSAAAHRWRFAQAAEPLSESCLFDPSLRLGVCGDWCAGSRVEGAFLSGCAMAERILGRLGASTESSALSK